MGTDLLKRDCDPEIREFLLCVTLLDPRFKSLYFCIHEEKSQVYYKVTHITANAFPNQSRPTQPPELPVNAFSLLPVTLLVPADRV